MKIDGGEMFVRALARENVQQIFALHGGHVDPIFQACMDHGVRIIDTRHEQAAGHMADAWARATGRPGVAVVTAGPGVTDIVTAVANAYMDCVPMLVVGGRHGLGEDEQMPLQELHGVPIMQSITKWSRLVRDPRRIPEYVAMAYRQATTGRPGPVFLEIPVDVLAAQVEENEVRFPHVYRPESAPSASEDAVERALAVLSSAKRPVIMAGRGVWFSQAADQLREFAELTNIPVCANGMIRGAVPEGSPLGLGSFALAGRFMPLAGGADAVLLLGAREGMFTGGRQSIIPRQATVIQVDIEAEEIGRGRDIDIGIVADCRETLRSMTQSARGREWPRREDWLLNLQRARTAAHGLFASYLSPDRDCIHPYRLAHDVSSFVADKGVLVADGGETFVWAELAYSAQRPGRYLGHGYLGCLGTGIPFGLAAKLAHPDEAVLVLTGDGSVGLNFTEFDTAVRHSLPVVVVINNDQAWGMCKHGQEVAYGKDRVVGTELGATRYEQAAAAFGVHAEFVERIDEIVPAIERALASGRPACVNVMTDPEAVSPLVQAEAVRVERPWAEASSVGA